MSPHDPGVTDLLRRASDLAPDVRRLVAGGIDRGRSRQRRARIGTTVASLAVIGVVGGTAAVVPLLVPDAPVSGDSPGLASDTTGPAPSPEPTQPVKETLRDLPAGQVPAAVASLLGGELDGRISGTTVHLDEARERIVQFDYDGMITQVGLQDDDPATLANCRKEARGVDGSCQELSNGSVLLSWGPTVADGVTCQGVDLRRSGHDIYITSCNAAENKDSPPLAPAPAFTLDRMVQVVTSDYWFVPAP